MKYLNRYYLFKYILFIIIIKECTFGITDFILGYFCSNKSIFSMFIAAN